MKRQKRKLSRVKAPVIVHWAWHPETIAVLKPGFDQDGQFLSGSQKAELKEVALTPTKWTQIWQRGPKTVNDLVSVARLCNCQPGDLISIPTKNYQREYV